MSNLLKLIDQHLIIETGTSWPLGRESLQCIYDLVKPDSLTMETGIGYSTLVFAERQSHHTVCFPAAEAEHNLKQYAQNINLSMDRVSFQVGYSQITLPHLFSKLDNTFYRRGLDFSLIDGDHAWPIPAMDFYFISHMTKIGGYILFDDMQIRSVRMVTEFIEPSQHWQIIKSMDQGRSMLVKKLGVEECEWFGTQAYNYAELLVPLL